MIEKEKIGQKLRDLREQRGWTQQDVAERIGVTRAAISNIELGKRSLTLTTLKQFCEVFNVDITFFGIETDDYNELIDLTARIEAIFKDETVPEARKDELYRLIMKIYLNHRDD